MDMPGEDEYVYGYEYEFDLENPFTSPADEPITSLLDAEGHHAPFVSAAASAVRCDTARFISKVRYDGELGLHPRVAYLAQNYVDRFLSKGQLPIRRRNIMSFFQEFARFRSDLTASGSAAQFERKPWATRLLAISSVSGAALPLHQPLGGPSPRSVRRLLHLPAQPPPARRSARLLQRPPLLSLLPRLPRSHHSSTTEESRASTGCRQWQSNRIT